MNIAEVKSLIEDGKRAYRLRKFISEAPAFEMNWQQEAWKSGFRAAKFNMVSDEQLVANVMRDNTPPAQIS